MMWVLGHIRRKRLPNLFQTVQPKFISTSNLIPIRSSERIPQKLYENYTKYSKSPIKIQPKLANLFVYARLTSQERNKPVVSSSVPGDIHRMSSIKLSYILEPITFHMFLIMRVSGSQSEIEKKLKPQEEYFRGILRGLGKGKSTQEIRTQLEREIDIDKDIQFLMKNSRLTTCPKAMELGVIAFYLLGKRLRNSYTIQDDLYNWILAICEDSIISSHARISNLQDVPIFVLFDIMLRNPLFKEEYLLQTEIWKCNIKQFSMHCINNISIIKQYIDNSIYYGLLFEPSSIYTVLKGSLDFFNSTRTGVNIKLGNEFLNELIWNIALYASRYQHLNPILVANIQELLLKYYTRSNSSINEELSFRAYMGIVLMISRVSQEKGDTLFQVAQQKFLKEENNISKSEMVTYHIARIWLSNNPEQVVNFFNQALSEYERSSKLWLFMIRKLNSLGLLDEKRSFIILSKIVGTGIIIPKDIITELLHPVRNLEVFEEMYKLLIKKKTNSKKMTSCFLPKYISLLYKSNKDLKAFPQTFFSWDKDLRNRIGKYKGFDSPAEYARYLYSNNFPTKSIYYIGLILEGEAKVSYEKVFSLYKQELLDKDISPNIQCLGVILQIATEVGTTQIWNGLTPPQVAINQFYTHVRASESGPGIIPDDLLWKKYIALLSRYEYVSELSKIMKWWEDLKYHPPKSVLLELLSGFPVEHAKRHIEHNSKLKRESKTFTGSNWEWPTIAEYEDHIRRVRM